MQSGTAQVGVHHQHALAALGEDRGQVEHGGGFAFARARADDGHGVELVVLAREQEVRAQHTVGLGVRAFAALIHQQAHILRDDAQHGALQRALDVVNRLDAGIEVLDEEGQPDTDDQPDNDAQRDVQRLVRLARGATPGLAVSMISTMTVLGSATSICSLAIFMSRIWRKRSISSSLRLASK